jgi:uncharacterized delta-60 repeat protein
MALALTSNRPLFGFGSLDTSFGNSGLVKLDFGGRYEDAKGVVVQPDGKIVLVGTGGSSNRFVVLRLMPDGTLDVGFNGDGKRIFPSSGGSPAVGLLPDGKILVAMSHSASPLGCQLWRLNCDGSSDPDFGTGGVAHADMGSPHRTADLHVLPDGKILVAGSVGSSGEWECAMARFQPDGTLDTSFGDGGIVIIDLSNPINQEKDDVIESLAVQPDGKVVVGGYTGNARHTSDRTHLIARFTSDAQLDPTFGGGGKIYPDFDPGFGASPRISSLAIRAHGKILAVSNSGGDVAFLQLNRHGDFDTCFTSDGIVPTTTAVPHASKLTVDYDGNILLTTKPHFSVARFAPDGSYTDKFSGPDFGYSTQFAYDLAVSPSGEIFLAGVCGNWGSNTDLAVVKLTNLSYKRLEQTVMTPSVDAMAESLDGKPFVLTDGGDSINVFRTSDGSIERRGIFEFDLSTIPPNARILAARYDLDISTFTYSGGNYPKVGLYAYAGDNELSPADVDLSSSMIGSSGSITALGPISVQLDCGIIQNLVADRIPALGLVGYAELPNYQADFWASEAQGLMGSPPTFVIDYSLPSARADSDNDLDVDADDMDVMLDCVSGPEQPGEECCLDWDLDVDGDIDQNDFGILQQCLGGFDTPAECFPD